MSATQIILGILAIFASQGFWSFIIDLRQSKKKKIEDEEEFLLNLQKKIEEIGDITISYARDRINYLCERYNKLGYIPQSEYDSFIMLGESYIKANQNTVVKTKFERYRELPMRGDK